MTNDMTTKPKHGGARPGAGRKAIGNEPLTATIRARVTEAEAEAFKRIGGSAWLRKQINEANKTGQDNPAPLTPQCGEREP